MLLRVLFSILFAAALSAPARAAPELQPVPDAPPVIESGPPKVIEAEPVAEEAPVDEDLESTVIITEGADGQQVQEYRIRGRLYMVKVTPKNGAPYYLIDKDGDGLFDSRLSDLNERLTVPKWVIAEW